ncbi:hypothetical protein SBA4_3350007 [Candidatus Sulfopaludibacter sp. SbA4]|nr:hypothetical protein SBA4_3350007 [Candidatus Sulfopaludibacter sp. SbA4]
MADREPLEFPDGRLGREGRWSARSPGPRDRRVARAPDQARTQVCVVAFRIPLRDSIETLYNNPRGSSGRLPQSAERVLEIPQNPAADASANSGWQALGTWGVPTTATFPAAVGVSPGHAANSSQTFTFTFSDTKGVQGSWRRQYPDRQFPGRPPGVLPGV